MIKRADLVARNVDVEEGEDGEAIVKSRIDSHFDRMGEHIASSRQDMASMVSAIAQMMEGHAQQHTENLDTVKTIVAAPNEIVRGPDGRPIGTRKVMN